MKNKKVSTGCLNNRQLYANRLAISTLKVTLIFLIAFFQLTPSGQKNQQVQVYLRNDCTFLAFIRQRQCYTVLDYISRKYTQHTLIWFMKISFLYSLWLYFCLNISMLYIQLIICHCIIFTSLQISIEFSQLCTPKLRAVAYNSICAGYSRYLWLECIE